ncbi:MAG: hypothetical protein H3C35_06790 [Bacteroidetes bacterium]|nr:hypothetical protein [Bacteroidota bacterium]
MEIFLTLFTQKKYYFVAVFFTLRLIISLAVSDGTIKSDGITYVGVLVNLQKHASLAAALPEDETTAQNLHSFSELHSYLSQDEEPTIRLLHFQWFHAAFFYPILALFPSVYGIIIINNLFLLGSGMLLFRTLPPLPQCIAWCLLLFYPPLFYLTNNFFSEPLFIFLLSGLWYHWQTKKFSGWVIFVFAAALSLSRPIGAVYAALFSLYFLFDKRKIEAGILFISILTGIGIDVMLYQHLPPHKAVYHSPSVVEAVYLSNTPKGNGDIDFYSAHPELQRQDTAYLQAERLPEKLVLQIAQNPEAFSELCINKFQQMLFNVVPDSWVYGNASVQSFYKKISWYFITVPLWGILFLAILRYEKYRYFTFLGITFILHFFIIARFRYLLPVLIIALPFMAEMISEYFKKQNGSA